MTSRTGAQLVAEALIKENVDVVFGYPGGAILDTFDALYLAKDKLRFVLARHEQGAVHMADGYARATGRVGVVVVTSGPGATNAVTGIATANMDSVPLVVICGQVGTSVIGNDAFQEADVTGITRPVSKHNYLVNDIKELPNVIKEAFHIAATGRPGPVVIDLPKDVQKATTNIPYPETVDIPTYQPNYEGNMNQVRKMAAAIKKAKKPLAYVGGGAIIAGATEELYKFIKKTRIPVAETLMGLGAYPEDEPENLRMLGMHGTCYANYAVQDCDLLIAIGARFDDRVTGNVSTFSQNATIVQIDIDPSSISKIKTAHIPVVGDVKDVLTKLNEIVEAPDLTEWWEKIEAWRKEFPLCYGKPQDGCIMPQYVIEEISKAAGPDAIFVTDVGQHQMWAAQYLQINKPRTFLSSGGLGTMGFGLPAALGAQCGKPDQVVFSICGDGGFQMLIEELAVGRLNKLPVVCVVLNNSCLGMVRQWQELFYSKHYAMSITDTTNDSLLEPEATPRYIPDFIKVAEAYDCIGERVTKSERVAAAIKEAMEKAKKERRPALLEFVVEPRANVFPMVPAGASLEQMMGRLV